MLRKLHNKEFQKKIWIVLLVLILPGFIVWGFSTSLKSDRNKTGDFGTLFNQKIPHDDYMQAMQAVDISLQMQLGEAYYQLQKFFDRKNMVMQRLVMLAEAKKRKLGVSDQELVDFLQNNPSFQRKGQFDGVLYEQYVKYGLHMRARAYEEVMRQNLAIRKLIEAVTKEVGVTDGEVREAFRKENEQLSVTYIAAIPSDFAKDIQPTEEQLKEYFEKNSLDFKRPLSFNLSYIEYENATQVKDLEERLKRKDSLQQIAKDNNLTVKETGLFGQTDAIPGIGWSQEISKALETAKAGDLLAPFTVQSESALTAAQPFADNAAAEKKSYLIQVTERKEPAIPDFKEIKDTVQLQLVKKNSRAMAREKIEACARKIAEAKPTDFEKAGKESGLKVASTDLFKFGSYIEGIGASDSFYTIGSKLAEGKPSEVIDIPSGFYIIRLKDRPAIDEKKFAEDKDKARQKLLADKKQEFFEKFLKELLKKAGVAAEDPKDKK